MIARRTRGGKILRQRTCLVKPHKPKPKYNIEHLHNPPMQSLIVEVDVKNEPFICKEIIEKPLPMIKTPQKLKRPETRVWVGAFRHQPNYGDLVMD